MKCRLCSCVCEKTDPQFAELCRTCGQKRETYAKAALSGLLSGQLANLLEVELAVVGAGIDADKVFAESERKNSAVADFVTKMSFALAERMVLIDRSSTVPPWHVGAFAANSR